MGAVERELKMEANIQFLMELIKTGIPLNEDQIRQAALTIYSQEEVDYIVKEVLTS